MVVNIRNNNMWVITNRKIFYTISAVLVGVALLSIFVWGLKPGIDFRGGSLLEVSYGTSTPVVADSVREAIAPLSIGEVSVRETGERGFMVRMRTLEDKEREAVTGALQKLGSDMKVVRFDSIGPILGKEAASRAFISVLLVLFAIVIFVAFAFRKVSEPVASWKYGVIAVVALFHDVIVPTGMFAILGHFQGTEVDTLFVTALLVILGFSVHDTIVVFDRTRENLRHEEGKRQRRPFAEIVGDSVSQTFVRSINTSLTTILALIVLTLVGPEATKMFSFTLLIGVTVGTYSSIFIASTLLVTVEAWQQKRALLVPQEKGNKKR
jgi:preprotein translocase subunit SecF